MKILIIGLGSIGKKHIIALKAIHPNAEVFGLRSKREAETFEDVKNIYSYDEILAIDPDFAIIANPTSLHKQTIEKLTKYSFPLFIEKPISSSLNIEKTANTVVDNGIQTYVACNLRFLDCIKFIKEKLAQMPTKRLNEVNVYCGSFLPDWRPNTDFRKNYSSISEMGGGVHLDLIHELDYIYWLFGLPNAIQKHFRSQSSLEISAFDYANYVMDYNGFCANVVLNYYRKDPKRTLELVFEDETWEIDLLKNTVTCNKKIIFSSSQKMSDTYIEQMKYFISSVMGKSKSFNTIVDSYNVLKICL